MAKEMKIDVIAFKEGASQVDGRARTVITVLDSLLLVDIKDIVAKRAAEALEMEQYDLANEYVNSLVEINDGIKFLKEVESKNETEEGAEECQ